jgi:hypothetical protein
VIALLFLLGAGSLTQPGCLTGSPEADGQRTLRAADLAASQGRLDGRRRYTNAIESGSLPSQQLAVALRGPWRCLACQARRRQSHRRLHAAYSAQSAQHCSSRSLRRPREALGPTEVTLTRPSQTAAMDFNKFSTRHWPPIPLSCGQTQYSIRHAGGVNAVAKHLLQVQGVTLTLTL